MLVALLYRVTVFSHLYPRLHLIVVKVDLRGLFIELAFNPGSVSSSPSRLLSLKSEGAVGVRCKDVVLGLFRLPVATFACQLIKEEADCFAV